MSYKHLSLEEREKLYALNCQGLSLREIGKRLKRSDTTLGREFKRNAKYGAEYIPKGVSIDQITDDQVKKVEKKLNSTPRKKLGY